MRQKTLRKSQKPVKKEKDSKLKNLSFSAISTDKG
jgi:hypothetical protein